MYSEKQSPTRHAIHLPAELLPTRYPNQIQKLHVGWVQTHLITMRTTPTHTTHLSHRNHSALQKPKVHILAETHQWGHLGEQKPVAITFKDGLGASRLSARPGYETSTLHVRVWGHRRRAAQTHITQTCNGVWKIWYIGLWPDHTRAIYPVGKWNSHPKNVNYIFLSRTWRLKRLEFLYKILLRFFYLWKSAKSQYNK